VLIGADRIGELIHKTRPGVPVSNPATAALAAFTALKAKRISILTPYVTSVNEEMADYFTSYGFEVMSIAGFAIEKDADMTAVTPADIEKAALEVCNPDADLIFISCTAMRAAEALASIEKKLGKPAVSSNQAMVWHSLKQIGYGNPVHGFGVLLAEHL